jgi:hypothetical protein
MGSHPNSRLALALKAPRICVIIVTPPSPISSLASQTGILRGGFAPRTSASNNKVGHKQMAKYVSRSCPRCKGYVGVVLQEPGRNTPVRAVNGHCLGCGYQLAWIVIRGKQPLLSVPAGHSSPNAKKRRIAKTYAVLT